MKRIETPEQRLNNLAREYYHQTKEREAVHCRRWQDLRREEEIIWMKRMIDDEEYMVELCAKRFLEGMKIIIREISNDHRRKENV